MRKRVAMAEMPKKTAARTSTEELSHPGSRVRFLRANPMSKALSIMASAMSAYSLNRVP